MRALSWKQVDEISRQFLDVSPYERDAIPKSILKVEDDNYDPKTKIQRQLWCVAISAKRYALFLRDSGGIPNLLRNGTNNKEGRWSEHGLGHVLNPTDPESEDRDWIGQVWLNIVRRAFDLSIGNLGFEHSPAIGRMPIGSPAASKPLSDFNAGKRYGNQIKPFNFLLTAHVAPLGHPLGVDAERFHLIAPYETDPKKWLKTSWIDQYTGELYSIKTTGHHGSRRAARVKTLGDTLREYEYHPESKCADSAGRPCTKKTVGLLRRRQVRIDYVVPIGKESNNLEGVEAGLIHSEQDVYTEYPDPRSDQWEAKIRPALRKISLSVLQKQSGLSRRTLINARMGNRRPHRKNQELLTRIVRKLGVI